MPVVTIIFITFPGMDLAAFERAFAARFAPATLVVAIVAPTLVGVPLPGGSA